MNPYNPTRPGNLFVGYERLRRQIFNGFVNGNSFALLGGRRCGKTSLLIQLEKDLQSQQPGRLQPIVERISIQGLDELTVGHLFERIYKSTTSELDLESGQSTPGLSYRSLLRRLDGVGRQMAEKWGQQWTVVLLVDELDSAIKRLPDLFFENLRHLLMESRFAHRFRLLATGVDLSNLIASGSSPLNNLRHKYLGRLTAQATDDLIFEGFPEGVPTPVRQALIQMTGRHPYLLQGILEKLWEEQPLEHLKQAKRAARDFLREHDTFSHWFDSVGPAGRAVCRELALAEDGSLPVREIRRRLPSEIVEDWEEGVTRLSYHGVVDDTDPELPRLVCSLFRDWLLARIEPDLDEEPKSKPIRVFYSYSHKDEELRESLEEHLAILSRSGVIEEWHDRRIRAGQTWESEIDENLERADIILLLVSSSFLASDYCAEVEVKRALQRHDEGTARVIPIILRAVDWGHARFAELHALPKDAKPVSSWSNTDEAWMDVAKRIRKIAEEIRGSS